MTEPLDLDELERLLAAATPRPWFCDKTSEVYTWDGDDLIRLADMSEGHGWKPEVNGTFIVAAVNALPDLIARVRAAEAQSDENEAKFHDFQGRFQRCFDAHQAALSRADAAEARVTELEERTKLTKVNQKNLLTFDGMAELIARQAERIAALESAARAALDEMTGRTVPKGTQLWCNWCDSTPIGSDDPRMEERDYAQHYTDCPVGALAALVGGDA